MDITVFYAIGITLVVVGVIVIVVAIILASVGGSKKGKVHGAGVIMIGPIPIIFGTDKKSVKSVLTLCVITYNYGLNYYCCVLLVVEVKLCCVMKKLKMRESAYQVDCLVFCF